MPRSILIAESRNYSREAIDLYSQHGEVREADLDRVGLLDAVPDIEVVVVRLRNHLDAEFFARAERLRYVVTPITGLTHLDLAAAADKGVTILSLKGEQEFLASITSTAELAWGLLLTLVWTLPSASAHVLTGGWNRDEFPGPMLTRKTLGLIGYGRLGCQVARYGMAFGMRIIAADPKPLPLEEGVTLVDHEQLYRESDVVSVHAPLDESTTGLIDQEAIGLMR